MARAFLAAAAVTATLGAAAVEPTHPAFDADRLKAHVTFLADDLLEGREAGTAGHEIAARYIATQFALLGLKPGGHDGSYLQTVPLLEAENTRRAATLVLRTARGARGLKDGETAVIVGPAAAGVSTVKAPLVFVGYGMRDAAAGVDDYADLDVRGKIVVALWGTPKGMDSEIAAHLRSEQARTAAAQGARAMLRVPTRAMTAAVPWKRMLEFSQDPLTTWIRNDGTPFDPSHGLEALATVEPGAAAALFDASPRTLQQVMDEADQSGGRPAGFLLRTTAEIAVTARNRRYSSPSVIGIVEGSDPQLKDEYVVLMGHADHIGLKAPGPATGDRVNNGALDNAAGISVLIEVARALTSAAHRPRRSVLFVAVTAEEKGLLGAEYFARHPPVPIERITAAINLDMPLLTYEFTDVVAFGSTHSTLERAVRKAGADMGVDLAADPMPEQAIFVRSDHYPMVKVGVPAVMLATGMGNGGQAEWGKFLSTHYHQPSDDLALPIVWAAGAKFAELNYRAIRTLADDDERARWYAGDYFGDKFAAEALKAPKPATP